MLVLFLKSLDSGLKRLPFLYYLVKYVGKNNRGKYQLSRKAVLEAKLNGGRKPNGAGRPKNTAAKDPPSAEMTKKEVDVIAQAIEAVEEL